MVWTFICEWKLNSWNWIFNLYGIASSKSCNIPRCLKRVKKAVARLLKRANWMGSSLGQSLSPCRYKVIDSSRFSILPAAESDRKVHLHVRHRRATPNDIPKVSVENPRPFYQAFCYCRSTCTEKVGRKLVAKCVNHDCTNLKFANRNSNLQKITIENRIL